MNMKMKMNKACDLSSISVFPPPIVYPSRRPNNVPSGFQASQHRSQPSQQSFSQGLSSQHGMSHFSQNSLDEAVTTNDQRVCSQEHDNSLRKISNLPRLTYSREESQPPNSRSSSMIKWNSADHKSQLSEGLEHRIGIMETSLSRFAMIFDSVQSDVMQVNRGTKELALEMECIRQKLIALDNSLQLMTKGQEEIKASIDGSLKSLSEHMSNQEKLQEAYSVVSALPQLIKASLQSVQNGLHNTTTEMQEISYTLKSLNQKDLTQSILSSKSISNQVTTSEKRQPHAIEAKMSLQATVAPKVGTGGWKRVKKERVTFSDRISEKVHKQKEPYTEKYVRGGRDCTVVIESDEDTDGGFSCLVEEKSESMVKESSSIGTSRPVSSRPSRSCISKYRAKSVGAQVGLEGKSPSFRASQHSEEPFQPQPVAPSDLFGNLTKEEEEETERILRNARRRKRRYSNVIAIH